MVKPTISKPPPIKIKSQGVPAGKNSNAKPGSGSKSGTKKVVGAGTRTTVPPPQPMRLPKLMVLPRKTMTIKYPEVKLPPPYWPQLPSTMTKEQQRDLSTPKPVPVARALTPPKFLTKPKKPYVRPPPPPYDYLRGSRKQKTEVDAVGNGEFHGIGYDPHPLDSNEMFGSFQTSRDDLTEADPSFASFSDDPAGLAAMLSSCTEDTAITTEAQAPVKRKTHVCGRPVPPPKPEPVYSEVDFSKYQEVYNDIIEKEYGPGAHRHPIPPPPEPEVPGFRRSNHRVKEIVTIHESIKFRDHSPVPAPIHGGRIIVDDEHIVTPESSMSSTETHEDVDRPKTALPYWINREDWDDKKMLAARRRKILQLIESSKKTKENCTQLFPGRCFNEWDEQFKRQQHNEIFGISEIHRGNLFRQSPEEKKREEDLERRQLKYQRMWEQLDVWKPDELHPHIPYRQGSTVVLGFPGHGSITGHLSHHDFHPLENPSQNDIDIHNLKLQYYKRMASLYQMAESDKKERERERMMAATKYILQICPSLLGDPHQPTDEGEQEQSDSDHTLDGSETELPWFVPYDKYDLEMATKFGKRNGHNSTYQPPLPAKTGGSNKTQKSAPLDAFDQILAKPDHEATFFKICPTCRRYVRTSDLSTHPKECCAPRQEENPNKFSYFNGYRTKSYHVNAKPIIKPKNTSKYPQNRSTSNQPGPSKPQQKGPRVHFSGGASTSTDKKVVLGDAAHPNPQFHGELLKFHPSGYYFTPADLSKRATYFKTDPASKVSKAPRKGPTWK